MTVEELDTQVDIMLRHLMVTFKKFPTLNGSAIRFIVEDFGVVVCVMDRMDYGQLRDFMENHHGDWRKVFIAVGDDMKDKKYETIWELMKGGYMKWIRINFKRQFDNLITMQNFGNMIIDQRLKLWNGMAKYKFMIEDNEDAKTRPASFILTREPAFFDSMPE
jgi:hypothetical protein